MAELKPLLMLNREMSWIPCYLKSDADKELAKLNRQVKFLQTTHSSCNECNKCADGMGRVFDEYLDELKKDKSYLLEHTTEVINSQERLIRHQKYKRCYHIALTLRKRLDDSFLESSLQITWLIKWINRWLELANKFKELK